MTESNIFDSCSDSCGWVAAVIAALAYGSYGVPIKQSVDIDVHPLVFQSYKTGTMFLTCWLVLTMGVSVMWTPWGLLSGLLWVVGGCGGIYAIRTAGMAVAVGTWASVMILVNFVWGILVFQEPVADIWGTVGAFNLLILGLIGMSHYSAPLKKHEADDDIDITPSDLNDKDASTERDALQPETKDKPNDEENGATSQYVHMQDAENCDEVDCTLDSAATDTDFVVLCGIQMTERQSGILGAVFNGVMTGTSLVPLHFAKQHGFGGANYMISFSCGAMLANVLIWAIFFLQRWVQVSAAKLPGSILWQAYSSMPSWHFRQLWLQGLAAGILLSIAMFGSILSTTYLGNGIGNSIVQSKILISGLWGIFWYREITGSDRISKWFVAAGVTVCAILWLSYERMAATKGGGSGGHRALIYD